MTTSQDATQTGHGKSGKGPASAALYWLQAVVVALGLAWASGAHACSCVRVEDDKAFLDDVFERSDAVVHAKVVELVTAHEARIELIEAFKGRPTTLKAQRGNEGMCGTTFRLGEEAVFVSYLGQVGACGRMQVDRKLLDGLRTYRR